MAKGKPLQLTISPRAPVGPFIPGLPRGPYKTESCIKNMFWKPNGTHETKWRIKAQLQVGDCFWTNQVNKTDKYILTDNVLL